MSRKIAALAGIIILVALALTLLWRVYVHHSRQDPDVDPVIEVVSVAVNPTISAQVESAAGRTASTLTHQYVKFALGCV